MIVIRKQVLVIGVIILSFVIVGFKSYNDFSIINPIKEQSSLHIGDKAPELKFTDPSGIKRSLSDLRGKVVLIDFWASWNRPSRMEMPNVVKAYIKYKDKGFEIYSVSLDRNKTDWIKAIKEDGLIWDNHVSDLKIWQSVAAKIYNVNSIPQTFLIDENGLIIAKNLRGRSLENKLEKVLK